MVRHMRHIVMPLNIASAGLWNIMIKLHAALNLISNNIVDHLDQIYFVFNISCFKCKMYVPTFCFSYSFLILQLPGKVYRLPASVCQCSLEANWVKSSVSYCRVSCPAFQVHFQPGNDYLFHVHAMQLKILCKLPSHAHFFFFKPTHEGYFACLDIWSVFLDFLTTKIKSRLPDRESVLNR